MAYDGTHSLLTDLLDRTIDAYNRYYTVPVTSPTMDALGARIAVRMQARGAHVTATLQPGTSLTLTSDRTVTIPITGIASGDVEQYAGQTISWITIPAGVTTTINVAASASHPLPGNWSHQDIGAVGVAGDASFDTQTSTFSVRGAGADIWGSADAFHFAYQRVSGDTRIVARVDEVENVDAWTKAGVMIRGSLDPSAPQALMLVSAGKGLAFQRRLSAGGTSVSTSGASKAAPYWVRLDRIGSTITAYQSTDGALWSLVGSDTIAMGADVFVGLAVSSHSTTAAATAALDRVSIGAPAASGDLPAPWQHQDIGAVGAAGTAAYDAAGGTFTVKGAGADVWDTVDALHFVYQPLAGDGRIVARVTSVQNVQSWTKAGVMIRASLDASSAEAFMLVSAAKGLAFQRRTAAGATTTSTAGAFEPAPYWVRLDRSGSTITAYQSVDGVSWLKIASDTLTLPSTVFVGLGVTSHAAGVAATAAFDHVAAGAAPPPTSTALPDGWTQQDVGAVGLSGSGTFDASSQTFTVSGAGADIWGAADAFHFAYTTLVGDGTVTARVASVQNTAAWAKAGVMIRETTDPDSAQALMLVSAGKGLAFQRRPQTASVSVSTAGPLAAAPMWIRLQRAGDLFTASSSADGVTWTVTGSDTIPMDQAVLVGLAVSSHTTSALCKAIFDHVVVE
jgi:regulation of enolase protein 1 (concanavalin A-like superfamily)